MPEVVTLLAFAGARDVLGGGEFEVEIAEILGGSVAGPGGPDAVPGGPQDPPLTAGMVMDWICARHPGLVAHRPSIRLAVNGAYVDEGAGVVAGDEVALIPPVAGG